MGPAGANRGHGPATPTPVPLPSPYLYPTVCRVIALQEFLSLSVPAPPPHFRPPRKLLTGAWSDQLAHPTPKNTWQGTCLEEVQAEAPKLLVALVVWLAGHCSVAGVPPSFRHRSGRIESTVL